MPVKFLGEAQFSFYSFFFFFFYKKVAAASLELSEKMGVIFTNDNTSN